MHDRGYIEAPRIEVRLLPSTIRTSSNAELPTLEIWLVLHPGAGFEPIEQRLEVPFGRFEAIKRLMVINKKLINHSENSA